MQSTTGPKSSAQRPSLCSISIWKASVHAYLDCQAHVLIPKSGFIVSGLFLEEPGVDQWEKVMRINYMGVVCTLKAAVPGMVKHNKGHVIVTNSPGSFMGVHTSTSMSNICIPTLLKLAFALQVLA